MIGECSAITVRLTAYRAGDIVADSQKRRLNFLFACVRHDDLANVHFDTRQYNHIVWQSEPELREKLENFILATIGKKVP